MIPVAEAIQIIRHETRKLPTECVSLEDARGRFLAEDVVADSDLPPIDRGRRRERTCKTQSRWRVVGWSRLAQ